MALETVLEWSVKDVKYSLKREGMSERAIHLLCDVNEMDGKCLLVLNEIDFQTDPLNRLTLRDRKCLYLFSKLLQRENQPALAELGVFETQNAYNRLNRFEGEYDTERISPTISEDGKGIYPAEKRKALLSFLYLVAVTWITAFVMVIVHDRVPDMEKYPPLPDIFLDNVPLIPWAFDMCEMCGTVLFTVWLIVLLFHKHRFILMRRFFALSGTVFLLRCVTMLITSLSVPGAHLQCQPRFYATQGQSLFADLARKLSQAFVIWRGAGLSIRGVRTCGDYMFSGHTVALTMLNFFITEYTPRHIYYLHTLSWMLNMFGIFFILAAHEHYSIDVFVAFYITSRLFLYYHTLSNNQALMQRDSTRTKVWFPLFSYFESSVEGIVPNEYETPSEIAGNLTDYFKYIFQDITRNYHRYLGLAPVTSRTRREPRNTIEIKNSKTKNRRSNNSSVDSDRIDLYDTTRTDTTRTDTVTSIEDHKPSTSLVDNHKAKSSNLTTEAVTRLKADTSFSSRRSTASSIQDYNKDK